MQSSASVSGRWPQPASVSIHTRRGVATGGPPRISARGAAFRSPVGQADVSRDEASSYYEMKDRINTEEER